MAKCFYENKELSSTEGLTDVQVQALRKKFGRNELTPPKRAPWWKDLLAKFEDPTILILLVSAILALGIASIEKWVLHSPDASFLDTIGIFLAIGLATLVGFFSERKSAKEFELLNKVKDDITVKALRNGQLTELHIGEVVVGDVIKLAIGDKIPADGVLQEVSNLKIEQSMMTGESLPVSKTVFDPVREGLASGEALAKIPGESFSLETLTQAEISENLFRSSSFAARGTMVADGSGWLRVTAVGDATQMGKIASALAEDPYQNETPLTQKLTRLAKTISAAGVAGALLIFTVMSVQAALQYGDDASSVVKTSETTPPVSLRSPAPPVVGPLVGIALGALILGFLAVRFLLKPFFQSMDLEMDALWKRFLCFIPMAAVSFVLLLGVCAMMNSAGPEDPAFQEGLNLLQRVLLSFVVAVTIIVVAVPEGLPMMVTVSLALNMMKMARENCLVRKLVASETIGSATVICTDKTGTLTQNHMTPVWGVLGTTEFSTADALQNLPQNPNWERLVQGICVNSTADLHIETAPDGSRTVNGIGNPTECAFLKFLDRLGTAYAPVRLKAQVLEVLGHNSQRKMSAVSVLDDGKPRVFLKGAPERVLARCASILSDGVVQPLDPETRAKLEKLVADASARGLRILAFGEIRKDGGSQIRRDGGSPSAAGSAAEVRTDSASTLPPSLATLASPPEGGAFKDATLANSDEGGACTASTLPPSLATLASPPEGGAFKDATLANSDEGGACSASTLPPSLATLASPPEGGAFKDATLANSDEGGAFNEFTLTGILGIADPLRAEVPDAVAHCQKAGIVVKMVTGDALPTARAIALDAGIYSGCDSELVLTSEEFNAIPDDELPAKAKALRVLARSTPADKLRLVKALHEDGDVVAMTGDGTNDAPALKYADVGLSMGKTGTEVAKEASDIVLMNDDFTNIVTGVRWGRTLYQNIQRFLQFQLSVNTAALLCAVIGPCVGIPLPLTVTQLLWINIIMDTFAAIAYSTQPPRPDVLDQPPIQRHASIITPEMMLNIGIVGVYQTVLLFASLFGGWFVTKGTDGSFDVQSIESLTIFFTTLVMFQFWHKFNCRALSGRESAFYNILKCRGFLTIVLTITLTQVVLVQVPAVGAFFRTVPLSLVQWLEITLLTSSVLLVGWLARKLSSLVS